MTCCVCLLACLLVLSGASSRASACCVGCCVCSTITTSFKCIKIYVLASKTNGCLSEPLKLESDVAREPLQQLNPETQSGVGRQRWSGRF